MKIGGILLGLLVSLFISPNVLGQAYVKASFYPFTFPEGEERLLADYEENAFSVTRMNIALPSVRESLNSGESHLLIVADVAPEQTDDAGALYRSIYRAASLRNYMVSRLNIPPACIAFYIDRSGRSHNRVVVYRVEKTLPWFANQEIYAASRPTGMHTLLKVYGAIPFLDFYRRATTSRHDRIIYTVTDNLFRADELTNYYLEIDRTTEALPSAPLRSSLSQQPEPIRTQPVITNQTVEEDAGKKLVSQTVSKPKEELCYPVFSLKTNLLPWATVVPELDLGNGAPHLRRGSFMPNLGAEFYFARRWSVEASILYAYFPYGGDPDNLWGVSSFVLSPRFWLRKDGTYRGFSTGVTARYGDFDIASPTGGRTGQYATGGLMVGYTLPLWRGLCMEMVMHGDYRLVFDGTRYRKNKEADKNYTEARFRSKTITTGLDLNLIYRFGSAKKQGGVK